MVERPTHSQAVRRCRRLPPRCCRTTCARAPTPAPRRRSRRPARPSPAPSRCRPARQGPHRPPALLELQQAPPQAQGPRSRRVPSSLPRPRGGGGQRSQRGLAAHPWPHPFSSRSRQLADVQLQTSSWPLIAQRSTACTLVQCRIPRYEQRIVSSSCPGTGDQCESVFRQQQCTYSLARHVREQLLQPQLALAQLPSMTGVIVPAAYRRPERIQAVCTSSSSAWGLPACLRAALEEQQKWLC